jgi:(p)ppGpp synthase/HD superfamily hydrolase
VNTTKTPLVDKAKSYAQERHKGQQRKFSDSPYFVHPRNTAMILDTLTNDADLIASGYLHDIIEDTDATFDGLVGSFNERIANIVREITNDNQAVEEKGKTQHLKNKLRTVSLDALLVKLADRYDNVNDLGTVPNDFSERYAEETRELLNVVKNRNDLNSEHCKLVSRIEACVK